MRCLPFSRRFYCTQILYLAYKIHFNIHIGKTDIYMIVAVYLQILTLTIISPTIVYPHSVRLFDREIL